MLGEPISTVRNGSKIPNHFSLVSLCNFLEPSHCCFISYPVYFLAISAAKKCKSGNQCRNTSTQGAFNAIPFSFSQKGNCLPAQLKIALREREQKQWTQLKWSEVKWAEAILYENLGGSGSRWKGESDNGEGRDKRRTSLAVKEKPYPHTPIPPYPQHVCLCVSAQVCVQLCNCETKEESQLSCLFATSLLLSQAYWHLIESQIEAYMYVYCTITQSISDQDLTPVSS